MIPERYCLAVYTLRPPKLKKGPHKERIVFRHPFFKESAKLHGCKAGHIRRVQQPAISCRSSGNTGYISTETLTWTPAHRAQIVQSAFRARSPWSGFYPWMLGMKLDAPLNSKRKKQSHHFSMTSLPIMQPTCWKKRQKHFPKKHPKTQHRRFFWKKCFRGASSWHRAVVFPRGGTHHPPDWRSGCGCARRRRQGPREVGRCNEKSGKSGCFIKLVPLKTNMTTENSHF